MLLRAILCGGVWNGFLLGQAKKEEVPCRFCGGRYGDVHLFWECALFTPYFMLGNSLSLCLSCPLIAASWPRCVCCGMAGCLGLVLLVRGTPGLPPLVSWLVELWNAVSVLILWIIPASGSRPISRTQMIWL